MNSKDISKLARATMRRARRMLIEAGVVEWTATFDEHNYTFGYVVDLWIHVTMPDEATIRCVTIGLSNYIDRDKGTDGFIAKVRDIVAEYKSALQTKRDVPSEDHPAASVE